MIKPEVIIIKTNKLRKVTLLKRVISIITIIIILSTQAADHITASKITTGKQVEITISPKDDHKGISPYIYGVNDGVYLKAVTAKSLRIGGNRLTTYNWETNASNAGADWYNTSDNWLVSKLPVEKQTQPAALGLYLSETAKTYNIPLTLLTLQMCGFVSTDINGEVEKKEKAPSNRWKKVVYRKKSKFADTPNLKDGKVYMDEYVNYLIKRLGNSTTATGIKAYALDNEPALWSGTHSLIQSKPLKCSDLIKKSSALASAVKDEDANALIFGPALYGFNAYTGFQDAPDWQQIKADNGYRWFIDYYLDSMKKESDKAGKRLLDVLDIHYYTEAKGPCGTRSSNCIQFQNKGCLDARMQSTRTLYEDGYIENSWIGQWGKEFLPILPNIQKSIDQYYPGTKIAITEYNYGGGTNISGGVAQADALGSFAKCGVFCANLWAQTDIIPMYQYSAINLYTNYNGHGAGFGNILVAADSSDVELSTVYAAINNENTDVVRVILTNKSVKDKTPAEVTIKGDKNYQCAEVYTLTNEAKTISRQGNITGITGNSFTYDMPAMSVTELVLVPDESKLTANESDTTAAVRTGKATISLASTVTDTTEAISNSGKTNIDYYLAITFVMLLLILGVVSIILSYKKYKKH